MICQKVLLEATLVSYRAEYRELSEVWWHLDDKVQGTVAIAGIFLAAICLRPWADPAALQGQERFSRLDIAILCGVALVVMGFFLPWAYSRLGDARNTGNTGCLRSRFGVPGRIPYRHLGWTIFVIALLSVAPVFVTPKGFLYKISILQLFLTLVGLLLVVSTLLRAGSHSGVGIVVCAVGFGIELIASGAKFRSLAA